MRARDPLPGLILLAALLSLGTPLILLHGYDLASQFADDAFYYFQIAKNVAHGHGFTFDGVHPTNGFHPLWLALLVPVFGMVTGLDAAVRTAGLLEVSLLGAAGALVYRTLRSRIGRDPALLAGLSVFMLPGTRHMLRLGLESALTVFMLTVVWSLWLAPRAPTRRHRLALGTGCALLTLCRLEAWFAALAILCLDRKRWRADPRAIACFLAAPLLLGSAYLVWNASQFGLLLPVSGLAKHWDATRGSGYEFLATRLSDAAPWLLLAVLAIASLYSLIHARRPSWLAPFRDTGIELPLLVVAGIFAADFAALGYLEDWYEGPAVLCAAIALGAAFRRYPPASRFVLVLVACAGIARTPYTLWSVRSHILQAQIRGELADWLQNHTPPSARIGSWNGGMLGYYSGRHVVILDGLANSPAFYTRAMRMGDLPGYLRDEHVDLIATLGCDLWDPYTSDARAATLLERSYRPIAALERASQGCVARIWKRVPE